ncbi:MAG: helix-turn-helix transcriptional regulator [Clostridia bacterium]|nr:helix-turn-helix transcriptional regulator [Clostridia bacterium]
MKIISFEKLYNTEFYITQPIAKTQYWAPRGNYYSAIGKPKISHTLLWFKNCSATITSKDGTVLKAEQNQLAYMAKGLEYTVEFHDTNTGIEDTVVVHFQMTDGDGEDIAPILKPIICIKNVDPAIAVNLDLLCEEFRKNIVCIPEVISIVYQLMATVCQKQKRRVTRKKFSCIRKGIELLEQDSNLSIAEIAEQCGVSECYFRRLFQEYSGESPMNFRQKHRIEKAKQLLLSDEHYTIGEIAEELRFSDIYHFSKTFKKFCGISPNKYLQNEIEKVN